MNKDLLLAVSLSAQQFWKDSQIYLTKVELNPDVDLWQRHYARAFSAEIDASVYGRMAQAKDKLDSILSEDSSNSYAKSIMSAWFP